MTPQSYSSFLVETSLIVSLFTSFNFIQYVLNVVDAHVVVIHLNKNEKSDRGFECGSFHIQYRLDGRLIAVSVSKSFFLSLI